MLNYKDALYIIAGHTHGLDRSNIVWKSSDGKNFKVINPAASFDPRWGHTCLVFQDKMWIVGVYVSDGAPLYGNDIWNSTDGISWSKVSTTTIFPIRTLHSSVVFDNKMWVIGGYSSTAPNNRNDVYYSTDGANWTLSTNNAAWPGRKSFDAFLLNSKMWIIGGYESNSPYTLNDIWSSTDGNNWTRDSLPLPITARSTNNGPVTYQTSFATTLNNSLYLYGGWNITFGYFSDLWKASHISDITLLSSQNYTALSARTNTQSVNFKNKLFVIGGADNSTKYSDVWTSTDAETFIRETSSAGFSARSGHQVVSFFNKLFVIGGDDGVKKNDVYSSTDGINYTQLTANATFSARSDHQTLIFNDKIYLIAGHDGTTPLNDVWNSTDGITWNQSTAAAAFSPRYGHAVTIFQNKMWLVGGRLSTGQRVSDVWSSSDGVTWTNEIEYANFSARDKHALLNYDDKLWLIGGDDGQIKADVWFSADGKNWFAYSSSLSLTARAGAGFTIFNNQLTLVGGLSVNQNYLSSVWTSYNNDQLLSISLNPNGDIAAHMTTSPTNETTKRYSLKTATPLTNDVWTHLGFSFDLFGYLKFYQDGVLKSYDTSSGVAITDPIHHFVFSKEGIEGEIDELIFKTNYDSSNEITNHIRALMQAH